MLRHHYNTDQLVAAYDVAKAKDMSPRWRRALDRAYNLLLELDGEGVVVLFDGQGAIEEACIPSQSDEDIFYLVNGHCDCKAGEQGAPCAHRAAKRLIEAMWDAECDAAALARVVVAPAPVVAPAGPRRNKLFTVEERLRIQREVDELYG